MLSRLINSSKHWVGIRTNPLSIVFTSHKPSNFVSSRNFNVGKDGGTTFSWFVFVSTAEVELSARVVPTPARERLLLLLFLRPAEEFFRGFEVELLFFFTLFTFGEPWGEFCKANSFLRVWGVLPALPIGELVPWLEPFFDPPPVDRLATADEFEEFRMAMRDGDKFVGEVLRFLGLDAIVNH